ncbi:MAG: branched-chain amino acid ABC transporter permease/ATP-binding protein [Actinomycetota bacterium]
MGAQLLGVLGLFEGPAPTRGIWFTGFVNGLVTGLLAMGIVLIYRSTKVINFAVGNMGLPGASLFALLVINWGWPFWPALIASLVMGAAIGLAIELIVVWRLFHRPRVILLVATVGLAQLLAAANQALPGVDTDQAQIRFPTAIGTQWDDVIGLSVTGPQLQILIVVPAIAAVLALWLNRTTFGKAVTASADNASLSRLAGISPRTISTVVWTVGGFLATLSMILLSSGGPSTGVSNLGALTLNLALCAAVIGGMTSFTKAMAGGIGIGLAVNVFRWYYPSEVGLSSFIFFLAVVIAVYWQSRSPEEGAMAFTPKVRPVPEHLRQVWWIRNLPRLTVGALLAIAFALTWWHESIGFLDMPPSRFFLYSTVIVFALCAASVTVVTGWSGQLSLAQMAYAGLGGLLAFHLHSGFSMDVGLGDTRLVQFELVGVTQGWSIIIAAFITAAIAALTGISALRVRGLLLAVSTFAFAIAAQQYLYRRPIFSAGERAPSIERGTFFGADLFDQRNFFYFTCASALVVLVILNHLRRSGVGRRIIAVRDNPDTASAYTVSPTRTKLLAFALAGFVAGISGGLFANLLPSIRYSDAHFQIADSLQVVGIAVIGGLGSITGAVLGAVWVKGLPAFWPDNELVPLFTSSIGLLVVLMYFPGGFIQIANSARDGLIAFAERRLGLSPTTGSTVEAPASLATADTADRGLPETTLSISDVRVAFGGNLAVAGVSLDVRRDEIVGLIGTNGAGKSTLMNAVGGYVPSTGTVSLLGTDVTGRSPSQRAALGLGRTFQAATLFPELTVRETVQVALEARHRSSFVRAALFLDGRAERRQRAEADELIGFLGLGRYADAFISDLSTGTRRIVELAGLLAVGAKVLCLDEPTAGVAQRETEAFGPLIQEIRRELGASMLIIEHDMPLIMSISDRVYCLESGGVISAGDPEAVRNDPTVIASYLGTDERAIARSDASR